MNIYFVEVYIDNYRQIINYQNLLILLVVIIVFLILNYKEINAQNLDKDKIDLCCTWGSELKDGVLTYNIKKGSNNDLERIVDLAFFEWEKNLNSKILISFFILFVLMYRKSLDSNIFSDPLNYVPKAIFFTKGKGVHNDYLTSFELALRDAKISDLNLVTVSSIKPSQCKIINIQEGRKYLLPGQITFAVMARSSTNEPNRLIASSIGLAYPADNDQYGYLSEHHSTGETAQKAGDYAEDMAMEMLATTIGLPNDSSLTWNEKKEEWKLSGKIYKSQNFTQSAEGHKDGLWTTVLSAAVFIL